MPTIMDALQANNPAATAQTAGTSGGVGTTNRLSQILQQTTGKGGTPAGAGPATQNFAEQAGVAGAVQQAKTAQSSQGLQTGALENSAAGQAVGAQAATAATNQASIAANDQYANSAAALLQQYTQGGQAIDLQRNQLAANQLAFNMRLSSTEYTTRLGEEGQIRRLSDQTSFQEATAQAVMGQELNMLQDHLNAQDAMTMSQDQWNTSLNNINIANWIQVAQLKNKAAASGEMFGSATGIVAGAAKFMPNSAQPNTYSDSSTAPTGENTISGPTGDVSSTGTDTGDFLGGNTSTADYLGSTAADVGGDAAG